MKKTLLTVCSLSFFAFLILSSAFGPGCGVYRFADVSIPDSIKTVRVNYVENKARYVNPRLSPQLTDRIKQKINNQTRLTQTNSDNVHYDITASITDYSVSTSAVSSQQSETNHLTVGVHIVVNNRLGNTQQEYDVSRSWEFKATASLQAAEASLLDEMTRSLTDDIFNRIFSNW